MSSKDSAFQVFGQRSIKSSALFRSSNPGKDAKEDANGDKKAAPARVSLSEFLDRRLRRTSASPGTVQGKAKPFSTLLGTRNANKLGNLRDCKKKALVEKKCSVDKAVFEQFKLTCKESGEDRNVATGSDKDRDFVEVVEGRESRKRRNPFEGGIVAPLKRVVVLGQAPSPEQQRKAESISRNEKRRPLYNHCKSLNSPTNESIKTVSSQDGSSSVKFPLTEPQTFSRRTAEVWPKTNLFRQLFASCSLLPDANGGGFWDSGMEGFESEEVGQSEVWEGVGSTTIGGIDWH